MGEIVRVLKWRLDLESGGMASGLEKAAASAEELAAATEKVGTRGADSFRKTAKASDEATTEIKKMGIAGEQFLTYLGRLEKGAGSTLVLERNVVQCAAALTVLKQEASEAGVELSTAIGDRATSAMAKATTQAERMTTAISDAGGLPATKLDKVITALEKTEASAADAWEALRQMGEEGKKAADALQRLEKASDSPRELQRTAALAELEMNQLKEAIDRARASGVQLGPNVGAALNQATVSITNANNRAAALRDTMGDMKTRGDQAAKGFEAAAGAAGSFEGMLGQLNDTGGKTSQELAQVGFKIVALSTAFRLGYSEGGKLRQVLTELGVPLPDFSNKLGEAVVNMGKFVTGSGETQSAASTFSGSLVDVAMKLALVAAGYGQLEGPESAAIARARQHLALREQQALAERALQSAFAGSGVSWASGYQELEKLNLALADSELRLSRAGASQKLYDAELKANGGTYQKLVELADKWGLSIDSIAPRTAAAAKAVKESSEAQKKATEEFASSAIASLAKVEAAHQKATAAAQAASQNAVASYNAQMQALNAATVSEEEYSARKKAIYAEMIAATQAASAAEQEAAAKTKVAQDEVKEALGTTPEKFAEVEKAAAAYNAKLAEGATPAAAMKAAIEGLATGMFSVATAMGEAGAAAGTINFDGMSASVKTAAQAAAEAGTNLTTMASGLDSIAGAGGRALGILDQLAGKFHAVAAAAAAAAGSGGGQGDSGFVGPPDPNFKLP